MAIFQAGRSRGVFIQACARVLWLMCAEHYITLNIAHTPGVALIGLADAPSCWHMEALFIDSVNQLVKDRGISLVHVDTDHFNVAAHF